MITLAICDDDHHDLIHISNLVNQYKIDRKLSFDMDIFFSPLDLLNSMEKTQYDILLLDILMPGFNGISTAKEARMLQSDTNIIFLTSSPEYAIDSYSVGAYYYFLKPCTALQVYPVLDKLFSTLLQSDHFLCIQSPSKIVKIPYSKLELIEVQNKVLYFYLSDGNCIEIPGTLSKYESILLKHEEFIKVHRSYIVNMGFVSELRSHDLITFSNHTIPISRLLYSKIKNSYINHIFLEKEIH